MRIRKHAKISDLLHTAASLNHGAVLQTYVCQLNQSPWDVMSFSPPPPPPSPPPLPQSTQVKGVDVSGGNCNSDRRQISVGEREIKDEEEFPNVDKNVEEKRNVILCCKRDGKSRHCRRGAAAGSTECERRLSLSKNYQMINNKSEKSSHRQCSSRSSSNKVDSISLSASSNWNEFYYYSGFRPGWSKKMRGSNDGNSRNSDNGELGLATSSSCSPNEEDENEEDQDQEDSDESEEIKEKGKQKRVRKPIKERSLKSLM